MPNHPDPLPLGLPLPPGFAIAWDPQELTVRDEWCGETWHYSMAGYNPDRVQLDALRHRIDCHTPPSP